jgi:hypothetical protein
MDVIRLIEKLFLTPRHPSDVDEQLDIKVALLRLSPKYRAILVLRAMGYPERACLRRAHSRSHQDYKRAEQAFRDQYDFNHRLLVELGLAA